MEGSAAVALDEEGGPAHPRLASPGKRQSYAEPTPNRREIARTPPAENGREVRSARLRWRAWRSIDSRCGAGPHDGVQLDPSVRGQDPETLLCISFGAGVAAGSASAQRQRPWRDGLALSPACRLLSGTSACRPIESDARRIAYIEPVGRRAPRSSSRPAPLAALRTESTPPHLAARTRERPGGPQAITASSAAPF